jgi:pimeloyl-ACP methyl ester carboxylesterase
LRGILRTTIRWILRLAFVAIALIVIFAGGSLIAAILRERGPQPQPPSEGRLVLTDDGAVFAQIRGPEQGTPVILIHGTAAWSGFWTDIAGRLANDGFRSIAIDLPPFGYSDRSPQGAYTRADQARRLAGLIRSLGLSNSIIVGHSFGAGATVETIMRHPSLFRGMVIISGALALPANGEDYPPEPAPLRWAVNEPFITEILVASVVTNPLLLQPLLSSFLANKQAATDEQAGILKAPYARSGTTKAYAQWLPNLFLADRNAASANLRNYASIDLPTFLIWGDRDTVTPLAQGLQLKQLIRKSELSVLENVGHIPHIEAPAGFYDALVRSLRGIALRSSPARAQ